MLQHPFTGVEWAMECGVLYLPGNEPKYFINAGNNVDYVVEVESIGDPTKIVSGTTQITRSPDRAAYLRAGSAIPARKRHHAQWLLLSGWSGRRCAGDDDAAVAELMKFSGHNRACR